MIVNNIHELATELGISCEGRDAANVLAIVAKHVYRATDYGVSIQATDKGLSVSAIVEGTDIEIQGVKMDWPIDSKAFWEAVESVNDQAADADAEWQAQGEEEEEE